EPFAALRRGALETGRALLAARRLAPRRDTTASESAGDAPAPAPAGGIALRMANVSARHPGSNRVVLHDIDLEVAQGERVALVGASGSGKTTLLALAMGELEPIAGSIRAQRASFLAQSVDLFLDSVRNNLLLADPRASSTQLWSALEAAGLADT